MNKDIMQTTDFTKAVKLYDYTRLIPIEIINKAIDILINKGYLIKKMSLLDIGCGTGQFTYAFANKGFNIIGIDISKEMIKYAKNKNNLLKNIDFKVDDARDLNFNNNTFDLTISSKLFLHIKDWKKSIDEIIRVTKVGGYFVYINEIGYFSNNVRKKYRELADLYGYKKRFLGTYDFDEIIQYFTAKNKMHILIGSNELSWKKKIDYYEAFNEIKNKSFAEFWNIEEEDYQIMLKETTEWIHNLPNGFNTEEDMNPKLRIDLFKI